MQSQQGVLNQTSNNGSAGAGGGGGAGGAAVAAASGLVSFVGAAARLVTKCNQYYYH